MRMIDDSQAVLDFLKVLIMLLTVFDNYLVVAGVS